MFTSIGWVNLFFSAEISFLIQLSAPQIKLSSHHRFDESSEEKAMDNEDSAVHTELTNISRNDLKLVLERGSLVGLLLDSSKNLVLAGVFIDNDSEEPSLTSLDLSSGEDNRGWDIMSSLSELVFLLMLLQSDVALVVGFSQQVIRLSCHG